MLHWIQLKSKWFRSLLKRQKKHTVCKKKRKERKIENRLNIECSNTYRRHLNLIETDRTNDWFWILTKTSPEDKVCYIVLTPSKKEPKKKVHSNISLNICLWLCFSRLKVKSHKTEASFFDMFVVATVKHQHKISIKITDHHYLQWPKHLDFSS